jgi:hypothetical protein
MGCDQLRLFVTYISGQPASVKVKGRGSKIKDCLTLEDGADRLFQNVGNYP